jgi:hypothetical protein
VKGAEGGGQDGQIRPELHSITTVSPRIVAASWPPAAASVRQIADICLRPLSFAWTDGCQQMILAGRSSADKLALLHAAH